MNVTTLSDQQLLRYSRQIFLPEVDQDGQQRLAGCRVLVLGLGGLGSPVCLYLAGAGVGQMVLVDPDQVDLSNLHRQILHNSASVGQDKVASARAALLALNPEVKVFTHARKLDEQALLEEVGKADVVVDGTDNFAARFAVNRACVRTRTPLVYAAVVGMEGQASVFRADREDSPCYSCLYQDLDQHPDAGEPGSNWENCSGQGVLGPVAGIISCIQATETLKVLLDIGESLQGRLLLLDARAMEFQSFTLHRDPACPVCGAGAGRQA